MKLPQLQHFCKLPAAPRLPVEGQDTTGITAQTIKSSKMTHVCSLGGVMLPQRTVSSSLKAVQAAPAL